MNIRRILQHLMATRGQLARAFPARSLLAIEQAIAASESAHSGEIRFFVEGALHIVPLLRDVSARARAIEVFSQFRVWDTEHNNGVLIYLLLADHAVEIVADRGVHARVGTDVWESLCREMEAAFKQTHFEEGVLSGVRAVTQCLIGHFSTLAGDRNELPDKPVVL